MSKQDTESLKNPSKQIPPEAAAAMGNMGGAVKKQNDANAAQGIDSQGVPLSKSTLPPPPAAAGGTK